MFHQGASVSGLRHMSQLAPLSRRGARLSLLCSNVLLANLQGKIALLSLL